MSKHNPQHKEGAILGPFSPPQQTPLGKHGKRSMREGTVATLCLDNSAILIILIQQIIILRREAP